MAAEEKVIRKRLTKAPGSYQKNSSTAIAARQPDRAGVKLRPGESIEFIITDANSSLIGDHVRAWTLWEGWRGYDVEAGKRWRKLSNPLRTSEERFPPVSLVPSRDIASGCLRVDSQVGNQGGNPEGHLLTGIHQRHRLPVRKGHGSIPGIDLQT